MKNYIMAAAGMLAIGIGMTSCITVGASGGFSINTNYDTTNFVGKEIAVTAFDGIDVEGYTIVTYREGSEYKVSARSTEKAFANAKIEVKNGTLTIKRDEKKLDPIVLDVVTPSLNRMTITGGGSFDSEQVKGGDVMLETAGGVSVDIKNLECKNLDAEINGAGKLVAVVKAENDVIVETNGSGLLNMEINASDVKLASNGVGNINAKVKAQSLKVEGNGANKSDVVVDTEKLKIEANGVAKVTVSGVTTTADYEINGVASCEKEGLVLRGKETSNVINL